MSVRVAVNGLGRTGRSFLRSAYQRQADIEVVAVNDLADVTTLGHLLTYDSVGGRFPADIRIDGSAIVIDERPIRAFAETDPAELRGVSWTSTWSSSPPGASAPAPPPPATSTPAPAR